MTYELGSRFKVARKRNLEPESLRREVPMEDEKGSRTRFLSGVAKALNATGAAIVVSYDSSAGLIEKTFYGVKSITPSFPAIASNFFSGTRKLFVGRFKIFKTGEEEKIESKIREYQEKIKAAYYEIGKEGATAEQLESESVKKLIKDVKDYENEIERLKSRALELEEFIKGKEILRKEERRLKKRSKVPEALVLSSVRAAIESAVKHGDFVTDSDRAIFDKIAHDLLDNEMEIKILSASELGKVGNKAAVRILSEAVKFSNPYLITEIINSLINLEDPESVDLFQEMALDSNYRVRMVSLRGLYKQGEDKKILPVLLEALKDDHSEVRRTAVTFLGWKDYPEAVPGLVQTLQDKEERVRNASVSALANIKDEAAVLPLVRTLSDKSLEIREKALEAIRMITGKEITFNVELTGEGLTKAIEDLKEKVHSERISQIGVTMVDEEIVKTEEAAPDTGEAAALEGEDAPAEGDVPEEETGETSEVELTESQLLQMNKDKLLELCEERGIERNESLTKAEIIKMLMA